jgi:hypothetical protein
MTVSFFVNSRFIAVFLNKNERIVNKKTAEEFTLHNATIYGGYHLFSDYLASNGLDHYLEQQLSGMKAPWAT